MKRKGLLVVVSGPAGVGKGTLCKAYMKKFDDMKLSVSNTTRLPRDGERDGVEYNFTTKENFLKMIENDELLEYVNVFENYYGTSKKWVQEQLDMGNDIILEIDIIGAMNVKKTYDNALLLFIIPPSYEVLEKRLRNRNTDSDDQIRQRLERMEEEIKIMKDYDYFVVNDDIDESLDMMKAIIDTQRCSVKRYGQQEIESYLNTIKKIEDLIN
jgi:guanylate kinase